MRVSIITPVYNPSEQALRAMLASVRAQTHGDWELCVVDDCSTDPTVRRLLDEAAESDGRVKVRHRDEQGGIVAASNDAIDMATGEFIALLDHDDELHPRALTAMAEAIEAQPDADYLYSDEDKIDEQGGHFDPFLKPHWSPARLEAQMYLGHLSVMRSSAVRAVGQFRPGFDGSQDWDLALRVSEQARRIVHVREVLYHWRAVPGSAAAQADAKPWAFEAGKRAVTEHFARAGVPAGIEDFPGRPGQYRIVPTLSEHPLVSIVIPTAGSQRRVNGVQTTMVVNCVRSVFERSTYDNFEVVVVIDDHTPSGVASAVREIGGDRVRLVRFGQPFNFSVKVNLGARRARGDYILILNDDTEVIPAGSGGDGAGDRSSWIEALLLYATRPDVGSVGAKLHLGDRRIQHVGIVFVDGNPQHPYYGFPADHAGYFANAIIPANYLCATAACLMTRRDVFEEVGGFCTSYPVSFGDVDYGLKLHVKGYQTVVTPEAALLHYESSSREAKVTPDEVQLMHDHWDAVMADDPYYHPGFGSSQDYVTPPYLGKGAFVSLTRERS